MKKEFLQNFDVAVIWQEIAKIQSKRQEVDDRFKNFQEQFKSPEKMGER